LTSQPFNTSSSQPFNTSTSQPFNTSSSQPFNTSSKIKPIDYTNTFSNYYSELSINNTKLTSQENQQSSIEQHSSVFNQIPYKCSIQSEEYNKKSIQLPEQELPKQQLSEHMPIKSDLSIPIPPNSIENTITKLVNNLPTKLSTEPLVNEIIIFTIQLLNKDSTIDSQLIISLLINDNPSIDKQIIHDTVNYIYESQEPKIAPIMPINNNSIEPIVNKKNKKYVNDIQSNIQNNKINNDNTFNKFNKDNKFIKNILDKDILNYNYDCSDNKCTYNTDNTNKFTINRDTSNVSGFDPENNLEHIIL